MATSKPPSMGRISGFGQSLLKLPCVKEFTLPLGVILLVIC